MRLWVQKSNKKIAKSCRLIVSFKNEYERERERERENQSSLDFHFLGLIRKLGNGMILSSTSIISDVVRARARLRKSV